MTSFSTLYGSKWVATQRSLGHKLKHQLFQYPLRVEVGCNANLLEAAKLLFRFSTLYGSKWVATLPSNVMPNPTKEFQYPLRVEVGCNARTMSATMLGGIVSVPSTGRSGLQLTDNTVKSLKQKVFQYPLRVEVGCNRNVELHRRRGAQFQYPLRVEVGCNLAKWAT